MKLIHSDAEYEAFYQYAPVYKPKRFPKRYPCVVKKECEDVGVAGGAWVHYVVYFPRFNEAASSREELEDAFLLGLRAEWKVV